MHDRSIEYADRLLIAEYNVREDAKVKAKVLEKRRANKQRLFSYIVLNSVKVAFLVVYY